MNTDIELTERGITPAAPSNNGPKPPAERSPIYKLKHPITIEGKTITELNLDFEQLNAAAQFEADRMYRVIYAGQDAREMPMGDPRYLIIIASLACGINHEELMLHLKGKDAWGVRNRVMVFCGDTD
jgi:hypothetical protein